MRAKISNQTLLFSALLAILLTAPISHAQAQVVTNSIGMKLHPMPIEVGSPLGEFAMGVHEVTQEQYEKVMGTSPSKFKGNKQNPVDTVTWNDAVEFCRRLSELPDERQDGRSRYVYRLPTQAEWLYACRAGTKTNYSFGDDASKLGEFAWYTENSGYSTHPVGQKKPNPWGLYDMQGNVYEWVSTKVRGTADRLFCGGGYNEKAGDCLSSRGWRSGVPYKAYTPNGFRVVRSVER